jgi:hypothetical protein
MRQKMPISVSPEKLLAFSNALLVVAAVLTVVATVGVIYYGNRVASMKQTQQKTYQESADQRIAVADEKATQAHARADDSDKDLRNLQRQLNYRMLSPEQQKAISTELRSLPPRKVQILCALENQEAYEYAKQLSRVLEASHWDTGAGIVRKPNVFMEFGITIISRESEREGAQKLMYALNLASVPSNMNITPAALAGYIQIFVGPKP